jgi:hypothetical protein
MTGWLVGKKLEHSKCVLNKKLHCYDGYKNNNIKMAEKRIHIEISVNS